MKPAPFDVDIVSQRQPEELTLDYEWRLSFMLGYTAMIHRATLAEFDTPEDRRSLGANPAVEASRSALQRLEGALLAIQPAADALRDQQAYLDH